MAESKTLTRTGRSSAGTALFTDGMSSDIDPLFLTDRNFRYGMNVMHRGGVLRTRPGYRSIFDLPAGNLQGFTWFQQIGVEACLVFAVNGSIYQSQYPFSSYSQINGLQFYPFAKQVYFCSAVKTVTQKYDGSLTAGPPKRVLMMQDGGYTRAAYWDGNVAAHLNPSGLATAVATVYDNIGTVSVSAGPQDIYSNTISSGTAHGLKVDDAIYVSDTSIFGLTPGTSYYILTVPSPTTFTLSDTLAGDTLSISGAQVSITYQKVTPGSVQSARITYAGNGYAGTSVQVIFDPAPQNGITAKGHVVFDGDGIASIVIDDPGKGYELVPNVYLLTSPTDSSDPNFQVLDRDQTIIGGVMVWSGDRLWVAADDNVYASDIGDPFSFTEEIYFNEGGSFQFERKVTAMAAIPSLTTAAIAVFTEDSTSLLNSGIRDRTTWKQTPNFQQVLFPGVGCVSPRSIVTQYGEMWWMTSSGFINFAAAAQSQTSSKLGLSDSAMMISKSNLAPDLSGCAGVGHENFILLSVPYGDKHNTHTWVLDQAVQSDSTGASSQSYSGVWTGTRPVQWVDATFNEARRCFYVSVDYDGTNRLWEAFTTDRTDNGAPIPCFVETKTHNQFSDAAGGLDKKNFIFAECNFADIQDGVDVTVFWAGLRGKYKPIADWHLQSDSGSLVAGVPFTSVSSYRPQIRILRTPELKRDANYACSSRGIESTLSDWVDVGFSLLIQWTGSASLRAYRIFVDPYQENSTGEAPVDESSPRAIQGYSCSE